MVIATFFTPLRFSASTANCALFASFTFTPVRISASVSFGVIQSMSG